MIQQDKIQVQIEHARLTKLEVKSIQSVFIVLCIGFKIENFWKMI